jgi:hypothetical protein
MTRFRSALTLILVLMLSLTSVTMAVARAQAAAGSDIVICATGGTSTVSLDPQGNPVTPSHPCPFCLAAAHAVAIPVSGVELPRPPFTLLRAVAVEPPQLPGAQSAPRPHARGPPLTV